MVTDDSKRSVFKISAPHIGHLRCIIDKKHLGVVIGAGVSKLLHFPAWPDLIRAIARDPQVNGLKLLSKNGDSLTTGTQLLFQHFQKRCLHSPGFKGIAPMHAESIVKAEWRKIVHEKLYKKNPLKGKFLQRHPYLHELLTVIRKSYIVINYNFDNLIEKGLLATKEPNVADRGFDITWRACVQGRPNVPLIYHPNGFLPDNLLEGPSENLVLSEDSFADQLIDSMAGGYSSLLHQLTQTTCIFLGVSLADPTLKHLLRQHARMNPGHTHYYIDYKDPKKLKNPEHAEAFRDANFELYNLVTLFFDDAEIQTLLKLLTADAAELQELATECGVPRKYVFYLTGVPGAGKSTALSNFTSLNTYDEWPSERLPLLAKPWTSLTVDERKEVDEWIPKQFGLRNFNLSSPTEGIHILDRCPLDPLSFTEKKFRKDKAAAMHKAMSRPCERGVVFLLTGDAKELSLRARSRHRAGDPSYFRKMQKDLTEVYRGPGVTFVATEGMTALQVTKKIARHIHFGPYTPLNCDAKLAHFKR